MAYVNKQNLIDFWSSAKRYIAARDADGCDWTSVPVNAPSFQFKAAPRTPVNPVVEFKFTETLPTGDKSPDNPSVITGVSSVKIEQNGKNIAFPTSTRGNATINNVTITVNGDGTYTLNGTASGIAVFYLRSTSSPEGAFKLFKNRQYRLSGCPSGGSSSTWYLQLNYGAWYQVDFGETKRFIADNDAEASLAIIIRQGTVCNNLVFRPQLEVGGEATAFESPLSIVTQIPLGDTYYGGEVDIATGVMTVTWFKRTVTSVNNFQGDNGTCVKFGDVYTGVNGAHFTGIYPECFICSEFPTFGSSPENTEYCRAIGVGDSASQSAVISILKSRLDVSGAADPSSPTNAEWIAAFNVWLASNPITYYYKLYTPFTVQLDPVQLFSVISSSHVNNIFTDAKSMPQLTYAKEMPNEATLLHYENWKKTEKDTEVSCYPVPETDLFPAVEFSFTETPPASGDKGPSNPSTINGKTELTVGRCGKNLAVLDYTSVEGSGVTWHIDVLSGRIDISGTTPSTGGALYLRTKSGYNNALLGGQVQCGKTYTYSLSGNGTSQSGPWLRLYVKATESSAYQNKVNVACGGQQTYTIPEGTYNVLLRIDLGLNTEYSNCYCYAQVEEGETATAFEPCVNNTHIVNLNDPYYGGSIDLATGLMMVTQVGYELDSSLTWLITASADYVYRTVKEAAKTITGQNYGAITPLFKSSHYTITTSDTASMPLNSFYARADGNIIINTGNLSLQDFKDWLDAQKLAGTPVVVTYPLAVPQTVQLTPQQIKALPALDRYEPRLNTLFTDADSIQVSYQKSPIQTELEITDAILALGGGE